MFNKNKRFIFGLLTIVTLVLMMYGTSTTKANTLSVSVYADYIYAAHDHEGTFQGDGDFYIHVRFIIDGVWSDNYDSDIHKLDSGKEWTDKDTLETDKIMDSDDSVCFGLMESDAGEDEWIAPHNEDTYLCVSNLSVGDNQHFDDWEEPSAEEGCGLEIEIDVDSN